MIEWFIYRNSQFSIAFLYKSDDYFSGSLENVRITYLSEPLHYITVVITDLFFFENEKFEPPGIIWPRAESE
jgi:hypothetical protein